MSDLGTMGGSYSLAYSITSKTPGGLNPQSARLLERIPHHQYKFTKLTYLQKSFTPKFIYRIIFHVTDISRLDFEK